MSGKGGRFFLILVDCGRFQSDVDRFWSIVVDYGRFSSFFRGFSRIFVDFGAAKSEVSTSPAECAGAVEAK